MIIDNDLLSIQHARILAETAREGHKRLAAFSQDKLDVIVEGVADAVARNAQVLATMAHEETDFGNPQDKLASIRFVCEQAREKLRSMACVGVIGRDEQERIVEIGVPVGVIVALCPVTNPVASTVYTALIAIKSGNAVLFSPHPNARKCMGRVLDIMISTAEGLGLPEGCLAYLNPVSKSGTLELMNHPATSMILNNGVRPMLEPAKATGKPTIFGGTGNGPAFIERSADITQAARDIVTSKNFDYGISASAEHSVVVDACVEQEVKRALQASGAYFMTEEESHLLADQLFCADGKNRAAMVGKAASVLARRAGFQVPDSTRVLVAERKYVSVTDPYSRELLAPVLAFYVEDDWMHACEKCIELLLHERKAHTLVIHSTNEEVILQFALKKPVGRMLVNTPASFGGMGATTNLFPSVILGSASAGNGITADNVSPRNLIYTRTVGYGTRNVEDSLSVSAAAHSETPSGTGMNIDIIQLRQIITAALKAAGESA